MIIKTWRRRWLLINNNVEIFPTRLTDWPACLSTNRAVNICVSSVWLWSITHWVHGPVSFCLAVSVTECHLPPTEVWGATILCFQSPLRPPLAERRDTNTDITECYKHQGEERFIKFIANFTFLILKLFAELRGSDSLEYSSCGWTIRLTLLPG